MASPEPPNQPAPFPMPSLSAYSQIEHLRRYEIFTLIIHEAAGSIETSGRLHGRIRSKECLIFRTVVAPPSRQRSRWTLDREDGGIGGTLK